MTIRSGLEACKNSLHSFAVFLIRYRYVDRLSFKHSNVVGKKIGVLGNGPSLVKDIQNFKKDNIDTFFSVNDSVTSEIFWELRPRYHFLIDPFFFVNPENDRIVAIRENLLRTDWDISLVVPRHYKSAATKIYGNITILYVPLNELRGRSIVEFLMFKMKLGMPRAQNVLVAALSYAIWSKCDIIYLFGATHDWTKFMVVKSGKLYLRSHHYFDGAPNKSEPKPWVDAHGNILRVSDALHKQGQMFRSYDWLASYLKTCNNPVKIYNQSDQSLIDSFDVL